MSSAVDEVEVLGGCVEVQTSACSREMTPAKRLDSRYRTESAGARKWNETRNTELYISRLEKRLKTRF